MCQALILLQSLALEQDHVVAVSVCKIRQSLDNYMDNTCLGLVPVVKQRDSKSFAV